MFMNQSIFSETKFLFGNPINEMSGSQNYSNKLKSMIKRHIRHLSLFETNIGKVNYHSIRKGS